MSARTGASVAGAIGLVALAALGLAACGGGRLSHPDFVKQADALCREADKVPAAAPARSAAQAALNARTEVSLRKRLAKRLDKLDPPRQLDARWAAYRTLTTRIVAGYREEALGARAGDVRRFDQLDAQVAGLQARRAKVGGQLGFRVCGGAIRAPADPGLVRQVDQGCTAANRVSRSVRPQPAGPMDAAAIARSGPAALAAERRALATVRAEASSSRLPRTYGRFASAFAARVDVGAQRVAAARARDRGKLVALSQRDGLIATTQEAPAAQRLGFEVCGVLGQSSV